LVRAIVECLAPGSLSAKVFDAARLRTETENFRGWPRMPTTVEENAIWVNLNEPVAR
ncbi:MAG: hypothetical protein JJE51_14590, partial [Thermoanaerobaculia bacterium]|nr:hypothetical protein [Thermoanaerobaculia bacterium]